jgi:hypothetical protein
VYAFTALTVLSHANPPRAAEYTRMADEVAYSRLYMAGHYRSDLTAGAFLGDLIGDYETGTTNSADCPPATIPPATVPGSATPVTSAPVAWPSATRPSPTDPPTPTEPTAGCAASGQRAAGPTTSPR